MKTLKNNKIKGFSLLELIIAMTITLILLGIASTILTGAFNIRKSESQRTNALISAQAALNLMTREIANCGYGIKDNGIVTTDSNQQKLRCRTNVRNNNSLTGESGEDLVYYYDAASRSIIRHDRFDSPQNSVVMNNVNSLIFQYLNYSSSGSSQTITGTPTTGTGRIRIGIVVALENVSGQPANQAVTLISDVTLRNSNYILNYY
jgi:prepilin-type N-terminal cleavage/methylation domain-containing protein